MTGRASGNSHTPAESRTQHHPVISVMPLTRVRRLYFIIIHIHLSKYIIGSIKLSIYYPSLLQISNFLIEHIKGLNDGRLDHSLATSRGHPAAGATGLRNYGWNIASGGSLRALRGGGLTCSGIEVSAVFGGNFGYWRHSSFIYSPISLSLSEKYKNIDT